MQWHGIQGFLEGVGRLRLTADGLAVMAVSLIQFRSRIPAVRINIAFLFNKLRNAIHLDLVSTHQWHLPTQVINALLIESGPKKGRSAIFNEYMASYQHDWVDMTLTEQDYREGYRADTVDRSVHHASHQDDDLTF